MAYEVPDLPYDYDALEPHIDEETMRIHHDKHHQAYVDKANAALEGTEWADKDVDEVLQNPRRAARPTSRARSATTPAATPTTRFFWQIMGPDGGGEPAGDLADGDRRGVRLVRRVQGGVQERRHRPVRLRLGVARPRRLRARGDLDAEPGLAGLRRPDAAARRRRLGARLLPEVPEQAPGLPRRVLERRQLGRGRAPLRRRASLARLGASGARSRPKRRHRGGHRDQREREQADDEASGRGTRGLLPRSCRSARWLDSARSLGERLDMAPAETPIRVSGPITSATTTEIAVTRQVVEDPLRAGLQPSPAVGEVHQTAPSIRTPVSNRRVIPAAKRTGRQRIA